MAPSDSEHEFAALFDASFGEIWGYLRRRVASAADADDLAAEVFTVAWRRWRDIPPTGERRLWLYGVARHVLANHRRALVRHDRLVRKIGTLAPDAPPEIVDRDPQLWVALAALTEAERDLLLMRAWDQLAVSDIATLLGITPNAASLRLHKARGRLQQILDQKDPIADGDGAVEPIPEGGTR